LEAGYEYKSHLNDIFSLDKSWTELDLAKKRECISNVTKKCNEKNVPWGGNAAEWKLHNLHVAATRTQKNREQKNREQKQGSASMQKPLDRCLATNFCAISG